MYHPKPGNFFRPSTDLYPDLIQNWIVGIVGISRTSKTGRPGEISIQFHANRKIHVRHFCICFLFFFFFWETTAKWTPAWRSWGYKDFQSLGNPKSLWLLRQAYEFKVGSEDIKGVFALFRSLLMVFNFGSTCSGHGMSITYQNKRSKKKSSSSYTISHRIRMYGIYGNIYPKNGPNVGKYSIHGAYGIWYSMVSVAFWYDPQ